MIDKNQYLRHWSDTYKRDLTENIMPFWMEHGVVSGSLRFCLRLCLQQCGASPGMARRGEEHHRLL